MFDKNYPSTMEVLRQKKGITQTKMSQIIGCRSINWLSRAEQGYYIGEDTIKTRNLCTYFGKTLKQLQKKFDFETEFKRLDE